jgi:hypothetical protein
MKTSTLFSLVILYGAATVGYADEVIGRAPNCQAEQAEHVHNLFDTQLLTVSGVKS